MAYIGTIGERISTEVTVIGIYEYKNYKFNYYGETNYIYTFKDSEENVLVWKTTAFISAEIGKNKYEQPIYCPVGRGDIIKITGTVKDHSVYKETEQTIIQRVKLNEIIHHEPTAEERAAERQAQKEQKLAEQIASIKDGDFVWHMPYRQYKEHYSDCETLIDSFESGDVRRGTHAMISVIIREGRLKASGVRGEHYSGYQMENENGEKITYRAVSEANALKRVQKDFPENTWNCCRIFNY